MNDPKKSAWLLSAALLAAAPASAALSVKPGPAMKSLGVSGPSAPAVRPPAGAKAVRPRPRSRPYNAAEILYLKRLSCTPAVILAFAKVWNDATSRADLNRDGRRDGDGLEHGFRADVTGGRLSVTYMPPGEPARLDIYFNRATTVAIAHTHLDTTVSNESGPEPSEADMWAPVPDFVVSRYSLYVTDPGGALPPRGARRVDAPCGKAGQSACYRVGPIDASARCAGTAPLPANASTPGAVAGT